MNRRRLLTGITTGFLGGTAGCITSSRTGTDGTPPSQIDQSVVTGADGSPSNICDRRIQPNVIPAIVDPTFGPDWTEVSRGRTLKPMTPIIGIDRDEESRAYPISVLRYEIVNDTIDVPILVTYCPICSSGLTAIREVNESETIFWNTGFTWNPPGGPGQEAIDSDRVFGISGGTSPARTDPTNDPNLVMIDLETDSFWSQLLAQAICGPETGASLTLIPSTVTTWQSWRETHPETSVLLPPPHSKTTRDT